MSVDLVKQYLRAQNLEQVGRVDEAIELYEQALAGAFDATGPYDRLISIYGDRAQHAEVIRVAESALANVKTYEDKRGWYERTRHEAQRASERAPKPRTRSSE